jgi:poly(hydroxyalkanoate) depolymerase family esterase
MREPIAPPSAPSGAAAPTDLRLALRDALRLTLAGHHDDAARCVQRAMSEAAAESGQSIGLTPGQTPDLTPGLTPDLAADLAPAPDEGTDAPAARPAAVWRLETAPRVLDSVMGSARRAPDAAAAVGALDGVAAAARATAAEGGHFIASSFRDGPRQGRYKLFVPPGHTGRLLPLVVMLHGCTQDADDFAAGTAMNEHAREQGFFVLYPEQSRQANPARCWNWFKAAHRHRGSGEPALIAGMTRSVMQGHGIDAQRVFIAGLSAGGAMAGIVAAAYPETFAAAGVHSGLPREGAIGIAEALVPLGRASTATASAFSARRAAALLPIEPVPLRPVPTIVFHGDRDSVVAPANGEGVIAIALGIHAGAGALAPSATRPRRVEQGRVRGRAFTRTLHMARSECRPVSSEHGAEAFAEHWLIHGAGHGWCGGRPEGSYTDAGGPDASREMLRFFAEHPLPQAPTSSDPGASASTTSLPSTIDPD